MKRPGEHAEDIAAAYMLSHGLRILARNYRCRFGEIDIIADDAGTLVFIEVRMRTRTDFGSAAESIHAAKRARLVAAARHYLAHTRADRACRFDAFLVAGGSGAIEWLKNVICD